MATVNICEVQEDTTEEQAPSGGDIGIDAKIKEGVDTMYAVVVELYATTTAPASINTCDLAHIILLDVATNIFIKTARAELYDSYNQIATEDACNAAKKDKYVKNDYGIVYLTINEKPPSGAVGCVKYQPKGFGCYNTDGVLLCYDHEGAVISKEYYTYLHLSEQIPKDVLSIIQALSYAELVYFAVGRYWASEQPSSTELMLDIFQQIVNDQHNETVGGLLHWVESGRSL